MPYVHFNPKNTNFTNTIYSLEFSFRTTMRTTSFVAGENAFADTQFSVGLFEGYLIVNLDSQELKFTKTIFPILLNDAEWYHFKMRIFPQKGIWVEISDVQSGFLLGRKNLRKKIQMLEPIRTTRFGRRWNQFYLGCLSDIKVNGEIVDMFNSM